MEILNEIIYVDSGEINAIDQLLCCGISDDELIILIFSLNLPFNFVVSNKQCHISFKMSHFQLVIKILLRNRPKI